MSQTLSILPGSAPAADDALSSSKEELPSEFAALLASSFCASTPANNPPVEMTITSTTAPDASSLKEIEPAQYVPAATLLSMPAIQTANANPISIADANTKMMAPILDNGCVANTAPQAQEIETGTPASGTIAPVPQIPSSAEISDEASRSLQPNRANLNSISTDVANSKISESEEKVPAGSEPQRSVSSGYGLETEPEAQLHLPDEAAPDNFVPRSGAPTVRGSLKVKAILPLKDTPPVDNISSVEPPSMFSTEIKKGASDFQTSARNSTPAFDELFQRYNEQLRPEPLIFKARPQTEILAEKASGTAVASERAPGSGALEPPALDIRVAAPSNFAQTKYAFTPADSSEEPAPAVNLISSAMQSLRATAPSEQSLKAQPQTEILAEKASGTAVASERAPGSGALEPPALDMRNPVVAPSNLARMEYVPMPADSSEEPAPAVNLISSAMQSLRATAPSEQSLKAPAKDSLKIKEIDEARGGEMQTLLTASEMKRVSANDVQRVARTVANQIVHHVSEAAQGVYRQETRYLRINLRPEELGRVEIELKRDGEGRLSAQLTVENDSTHHALSGELNQLRVALERAGLNFDSLNISYNAQLSSHQGGQPGGGRREQADGPLPSNAFGVENSGVSAETESSESVLSKLISLRA